MSPRNPRTPSQSSLAPWKCSAALASLVILFPLLLWNMSSDYSVNEQQPPAVEASLFKDPAAAASNPKDDSQVLSDQHLTLETLNKEKLTEFILSRHQFEIVGSNGVSFAASGRKLPQEKLVFVNSNGLGAGVLSAIFLRYCKRHNRDCFFRLKSQTVVTPAEPFDTFYNFLSDDGQHISIDIWTQATHYLPVFFSLLIPDAPMITLMSDPVDHFIHSWAFHNMSAKMNVSGLGEFLDKASGNRSIPDILTFSFLCPSRWKFYRRNPLSLGCTQTIEDIRSGRLLVLISERFEESLMLLRRFLGWRMQDMYLSNYKPKSPPKLALRSRQRKKLELWLQPYIELYSVAQDVFQQRVVAETSTSFKEDVKKFRSVVQTLQSECHQAVGSHLQLEEGKNHLRLCKDFSVKSNDLKRELYRKLNSQRQEVRKQRMRLRLQHFQELLALERRARS